MKPELPFSDTIQFFHSFEEAENYKRLQMARLTPEERLANLEVMRMRSLNIDMVNEEDGSKWETIRIEKGELI